MTRCEDHFNGTCAADFAHIPDDDETGFLDDPIYGDGEQDDTPDDTMGDGDPVHDPGPDEASDGIDSYAEGLK